MPLRAALRPSKRRVFFNIKTYFKLPFEGLKTARRVVQQFHIIPEKYLSRKLQLNDPLFSQAPVTLVRDQPQ